MKKIILLLLPYLCVLQTEAGNTMYDNGGMAQVADALKGVWPVSDKQTMRSLNGEWQLKVINGIDSCKEVPRVDASWGKIPVPGCWEAYGFCEPRYSFPDSLTGYYRTA